MTNANETPAAEGHPDSARTARPEDYKPSLGSGIIYGLQHVLTMYAGLIAVPLIIADAAHLSSSATAIMVTATFFLGGVVTLIQTLGIPYFGAQLPLVQGVSFDAVATMTVIIAAGATPGSGLQTVFGSIIAASILGVLIAPVFSRFVRFFPPVVTGSLITVIGLTFIGVTADWAMGGHSGSSNYGSMTNIGLAAATMVIGLSLSKLSIGTVSRLSILLCLVIGTIIAVPLGMVDFSQISESPTFKFPTLFYFGVPQFDIASIISMFIAMLVILTETTADLLAIGEVVGTRVDEKRFSNGLRADMISGVIAPFFGTFPQSAFAQNIGLVAVTRVKSRYVVAIAGIILIILGLFPVMGAVVAAIPPPVLGGAGLLLFGSVAASGIRMLAPVKYDNNMNLLIVAVTIGVGILPQVAPHFYDHFPHWFQTIAKSGISSAAIVGVLLNLIFNHIPFGKTKDPSVVAAATARYVPLDMLNNLKEGDHFVDGQLVDSEGTVVPSDQERNEE